MINREGSVLREGSSCGEDVLVAMLRAQPGEVTRPLEGLTGAWWRQGLEQLLRERGKRLGE